MDWGKVGAIFTVGCFLLAGLTLLFQVKPLPWRSKTSAEPAQPRFSKLMAVFIVLGFLASGVTLWAAWYPSPNNEAVHFSSDAKEKIVWTEDKILRKQEVLLDNHGYRRCQMYDVTLIWNGTGPSALENTDIHGYDIKTDSDSVGATLALFKAAHLLKEDISFLGKDGKPIQP